MIKTSIAFLAGTVFATAVIVLAGGRASAMVALGFLCAVAIAAGVLWLTGLRRLARFLNAFTDGMETAEAPPLKAARVTQIDRSGYVKPSAKKRDQILNDTIAEYLGDDELFGAPGKRVQ